MLERKCLLSILFHRAQVNLFQHDDKTITKNNWNSLNQCKYIQKGEVPGRPSTNHPALKTN